MTIMRRLQSALRRHGAFGFLRLLVKNVRYHGARALSGELFRNVDDSASEFDREKGTDTEAIREIGSLDVHSDNARHAVRYQPSPHLLATEVIHSIPIDPTAFTFIDFGSGKGRVLLIAAGLPFASVVGIEFSKELCDVATGNIAGQDVEAVRAADVSCIHQDVTTYELPDTPLVCYFYNPFDEVIMRQVVERLESSIGRAPRDVFVIYIHPENRQLFDQSDRWHSLEEGNFHVVYRSVAVGSG